jgi:predicted nuclease of predicted toxin-antitoxin system
MRFLLDANLPLSTVARLGTLGHDAVDVRELGLGAATDDVIANHAQKNGFCLLTRDKDFGDIRNYPPSDYAGLVVIDLPDDTVGANVIDRIEEFLSQKEWLEVLPGRLAIVRPMRVRFRRIE